MAIKLKIKVPSGGGDNGKQPGGPKVKIRAPSSPQKRLKISLKKPEPTPPNLSINNNTTTTNNNNNSTNIPLTKEKPRVVPRVRIKPTRIPGEGYDSEAPDLEDDPLLEQGIIVRFLNDVNLDFVHNAIDSGDLTGINIKWVTREKAVVNVNGTLYSARLLDLPTVTELYKTVDKKNIFKTFDICQILLVLHTVIPSELNVERDFEVPPEVLFTHPIYSLSKSSEIKQSKLLLRDGLVDPYRDVYRRFKPRKAPHRIADDIEARVNELIKLDDEAEESHFELVDPKKTVQRFGTGTPSGPATPMATKSSVEPEEFNMIHEPDNLEEELERALDEDDFEVEEAEGDGQVDMEVDGEIEGEVEVEAEEEEEEEDDDEEEEEDDEEEDDDEEDDDEDSKADKQHVKLLEEEIADLEKVVEYNRKNLATATSKMLKMKFQNTYTSLKASLDQKKRDLVKILEEQDQLQKKSDPNHLAVKNDGEDEEDDDEEEEDGEPDEGEGDGDGDDEANDDNMDDLDDLF
ncbi:TAFII55 protein conserved region-domain-containing protein [Scheffersomyces amazonensis]|uniref:TAFII55 protein conserved region-domain-containing protein n=1 Tax=Scheffersomyces amazonensis TaxID=1078765 RepID=UPI00315DB7EE